MNETALIYARVSTDEQVRGYSLATQLDACQKYAADRGYSVLETFSDGYSGASLDRPELNKLRSFIAQRPVDIVVVYDVDRLARKSVYQMLIEEELQRAGTRVDYVIGQYEDTDEGRLQKQIRASIAEYEKAKILERSKRGKRGKAQSGYVLVGARPPYGYRVKSEPHKSWFEVEEEEAMIIHLVFNWYLRGDENNGPMSIFAITSKLTELGIPTRGDKQIHVAKKNKQGVWSEKMVRNILTNETYTGTWYYGKTKMVSDGRESARETHQKRGLGKQVARDRSEWIAVNVQAIISAEDFQNAQERLKLNLEQASRNTRREYLLGRRLKCSRCGYTAVGMQRRVNYRYYRCNGAWRKPKVCDMPHFRVDQVDEAVWEWVKSLLEHPEMATQGLRDMQADAIRSNQALYDRLDIINSRLKEVDGQQQRLLDLYLNGEFPKELLQERKSRLEETVEKLQHEQADITSHIQANVISDEEITEIEAFCADLRLRLENTSFEQQRKLIEFLDVRGKLAIEDEEKVVYVKCHLNYEPQRLSVARTLPLSNTGGTATPRHAFRRMDRSR